MLHLIKYRAKNTLREKTTLFWAFLFPFILGTLFCMAFGGAGEDLDTIETALVMEDESAAAKALQMVLTMMGDAEDSPVSVKEMSQKEAEKKLEEGKISGIFVGGETAKLLVAENGLEQSILQVILEQFQSRVSFIMDIGKEKPEKLADISETIIQSTDASYVKESALGGENPDAFIQYYFALLAMACLFGSYLGMDVATQLQGNVEAVGARRMVSSTSKIKMALCDVCVISIVDFISITLLLFYLRYILKVQIGENWPKIMLIVYTGCLLGISIGLWIGSMSKVKEGVKVGILTLTGLFSSFLSGLMIGGIKGMIEDTCPLINRINPASVITDALYSISIYPDHGRYIRDIIILAVWMVFFLGLAFWKMRRVRYDSI